ncbi:MAG: hypothetical protein HY961_10640 [Ignavibacteriae bacterium]|nr:hypothetical protein [Ignavibacteriota bacterium]
MNRLLLVAAAASIVLVGCNKNRQQSEAPKELQSQQQGEPQMPPGHPDISAASGGNSVAGVQWAVPTGWKEGPPKQMRVATYVIPAAAGDEEGGELGVFYFGSGQGGDVQTNIDRWVGQFENARPNQTAKTVNGMKVELITIAGTYLSPSGPMMQSSGKKENYKLLGAIVAAPEGSVFFKLTGPEKTVNAARKDFDGLVGSLATDSTD